MCHGTIATHNIVYIFGQNFKCTFAVFVAVAFSLSLEKKLCTKHIIRMNYILWLRFCVSVSDVCIEQLEQYCNFGFVGRKFSQ